MRRFLFLFLLCLALTASVAAQQSGDVLPDSSSFPGVSEVTPRVSTLMEERALAEAKLVPLKDISAIEEDLRATGRGQAAVLNRISEMGEPAGWGLKRLLEIKGLLAEHKGALDKVLGSIRARLEKLDGIRKEWGEKKRFWEDWKATLQGTGLEIPVKSFDQALGTVEAMLESVARASGSLEELRREANALQEKNLEALIRMDAVLTVLRGETFKRTARSFADLEFYRQFDGELWQSVIAGVRKIQSVNGDFLQEQGWIGALQILTILALARFIIRRRRVAEVTPEWQFILRHPWATGIFVAVSGLSFLYTSPPAQVRLILWALAAYSASVLISGLLKNPRKIFMVYLLASLFVLSTALQAISFPVPLYRIYLALVSGLGIPLLLLMAARNVKAHEGRTDGFTLSLRLGALILSVSFIAQIGGYSALASWLLESAVETVFLGLFAAMVVRLGRGGIDYILDLEFFSRERFFRRFGRELARRLKGAFQAFVFVYAALYLLVVWGLYESVGQAWQSLMGMGVTLGTTRVTLEMVILAALVLYASIVVSWVIRSLLETEFFPRREVNRGVRDSIKKLLHYSLVLIGFFLAMSLAGMELKHFAVLAGAFGIGIGFGLQNIVNNFVSGLILLFERPIKVGDIIVLDEEWGTISKIGLRSTVMETLDQSEIIVPNSQLISEKVHNWTLSSKMARVAVPVGVAYGSDVPLVISILKEAGDQHPDVASEPGPSPIFAGFGDSSLDFELRVWITDIGNRLRVRSDLLRYIDQRFRQEGVEIPFPQRDLHLRSVDEKIFEQKAKGDGEGKGGEPRE